MTDELVREALDAVQKAEEKLASEQRRRYAPVAIVGIGCRFPGNVNDPDSYWDLLREGRDAIVPEIPKRPGGSPDSRQWGGYLQDVDKFDAGFFHISEREAIEMDPQQRIVLEVAWEALENAGIPPDSLKGSATGVFVGIYSDDYRLLRMASSSALNAFSGTGTVHCLCANRISYLLDLRGPSLAVDTTCSSSLTAIHLACASLRSGDTTLALAGGVSLILSSLSTLNAGKVVALAADGRCKTFDSRADGIVRSEGCGIVVLKLLEDALRDGDSVYATILGTAVNQDGRSNGLTAPNGASQEAVIREAIRRSGLKPSDIAYVEAHGTGTTLGDPIEFEALANVFREPLLIGSVKTNIGHLEAASGIAGLIKTALLLHHSAVPPHLHLNSPNPELQLHVHSIRIPTTLESLTSTHAKRAGVSAFSLGGANAHAVLEETLPFTEESSTSADLRLLTLSASQDEGLRRTVLDLLPFLNNCKTATAFADLCYTSCLRRNHYAHRLAVVASSGDEAAAQLTLWLNGDISQSVWKGKAKSEPSHLAFLYPGQGADWAGIGLQLFETDETFSALINNCDCIIRAEAGWSLLDGLRSHSSFQTTEFAQPAIFSIQAGITDMLAAKGLRPDAVIGHSLGEASAAYAAGMLSLEDGLRLLLLRGRLSQTVAGRGRMVMLGIDSHAAKQFLATLQLETPVSIAAYNSPRSVTLAGETGAIAVVMQEAASRGMSNHLLKVDCAFHSEQMQSLGGRLLHVLPPFAIQKARTPLYSTVTGALANSTVLANPSHWASNLVRPVLFESAVSAMIRANVKHIVEIAPSPILARHVRDTGLAMGRETASYTVLGKGATESTSVWKLLARLYAAGTPIQWKTQYPGNRRVAPFPHYAWQRRSYWIETQPQGGGREQTASLVGNALPASVITHEKFWTATDSAFFSGHRLNGQAVLPTSGYLLTALAAVGLPLPVEIRNLRIRKPMVLSPGTSSRTVVTRSSSRFEVRWLSQPASKNEWIAHGDAVLSISDAVPAGRLKIDDLRSRLTAVTAEALYTQSSQPLEQGQHFRGIRQLYAGPGEALARVTGDATAGLGQVALIDCCLQAVVTAAGSEYGYVAHGIDSYTQYRDLPASLWTHSLLREKTSEEVTCDCDLYDDTGTLLARIEGLHSRRFDALRVLASDSYRVEWIFLGAESTPQRTEAMRRRIERECRRYSLAAVTAVDTHKNEFAAASAQHPHYRRLYSSLVHSLAAGETESLPLPEALDLEHEYPELQAEFALLDRCGAALPDVLLGRAHASESLFGQDHASCVYRQSAFATYFHPLLRDHVLSLVQTRSFTRILEVGAGTGGTTSSLVPHLSAARVRYVYTDVSRAFLQSAAREFASFPFITYELLDLEREPEAQGFLLGQFDLIIAANVVHAASDVRAALLRLRKLAGEHGALLVLEGTGSRLWADLTFGMTPGWWHFTDPDLRASGPLVASTLWAELLRDAGWPDTQIHVGPGEHAALIASGIYTHWWLVVSDQHITQVPGLTSVMLDPSDPLFIRTLRQVVEDKGNPRTVVYVATSTADNTLGGDLAGLSKAIHFFTERDPINTPKVWICTRGSQEAGSPVKNPRGALLWGFGRVLAAEHPEFRVSLLDEDDACSQPTGVLSRILATSQEERVLAIRHGQVLAPRLRRQQLPSGPLGHFLANPGVTYLLTGAFGGIGMLVARWLVERGARHIVLSGRSSHMGPDALSLMTEMTTMGAKTRSIQADLSVREDVIRLLAESDATEAPLRAIFHAAGVIHDGLAKNVTIPDIETSLAGKARGAWLLHELSAAIPLDSFVLFSSAVTALEFPGLGCYTAANSFLESLASYRRGCGFPAQSIAWAGWSQVGMAAAVGVQRESQWAKRGLTPMAVPEALAALDAVLAANLGHCAIIQVNWNTYARNTQMGALPFYEDFCRSVPNNDVEETAKDVLHGLGMTNGPARRDLLKELILRELRTLLPSPPQITVAEDVSLIELGLDSLTAIEFRNSVAHHLGMPLPATLVFDHPTIAGLLRFLLKSIEGPPEAGLDDLISEARELPVSELEELLAGLTAGGGN